MKLLDLSSAPEIPELLAMFLEFTTTTNPAEMSSSFAQRYTRLRSIEYFVGVAPVPDEPGAYRVSYQGSGPQVVDHQRLHGPNARLEVPAEAVIHREGLIRKLIEDGLPKFAYDLDLVADPVLGHKAGSLRTCMAMPVIDRGAIVHWALGFGNQNPLRMSPGEVAQSVLAANLLGLVNRGVQSMRLIEDLNRQLAVQFDAVARVQRALLPRKHPTVAGLEIATTYSACDQAGGDWYHLERLPDGRIIVAIADVSGHGAAAATITAMIHAVASSWGALIQPRRARLQDLIAFINERLTDFGLEGNFVTGFMAVIDPSTGDIEAWNCGHPPPRLRTATGIGPLKGPSTVPLGVMHPMPLETIRARLHPGDTLVLFTDGITEAFSPDRELFGIDRLDHAIMQGDSAPTHVVERVVQAVADHRHGSTRDDDQTMVVVRLTGKQPLRASARDSHR